ncbi:MAG: hypothetical protein ABMB14_39115, partial [Myxococcota bacterium]
MIGYVLRYFPTRSETFVARELVELRRRGVPVDIVAIGRRADGEGLDDLGAVRPPRVPLCSPLDRSGLVSPLDRSGLVFPLHRSGLVFPLDRSGLVSPLDRSGLVSTGSTPSGDRSGGWIRRLRGRPPGMRLRDVARAAWVAHITPDGADTYAVTLKLETGALRFAEGTTVRAWPIALPPDRGLPLDETCIARFSQCSMQALTAFFAFDVTVRGGSRVEHSVFVVRVRLVNPPEDRIARVLHGLLDDPAKVLRFLRLLLAQDPSQILDELDDDPETDPEPGAKVGRASANGDVAPLFESLVRTLARDPQRLQEVQRFVQELQGTAAGKSTLPADFDDVWTPLWA